MDMTASITRDLIIEKLSTVYDPEIPVNIWELGLIYDIEFPKPSEVIIHMTLTAPGCPIADEIVQQVHGNGSRRYRKCYRKPGFRAGMDARPDERCG
jgi:metal-sulfur cluster biosynthetic enzyme